MRNQVSSNTCNKGSKKKTLSLGTLTCVFKNKLNTNRVIIFSKLFKVSYLNRVGCDTFDSCFLRINFFGVSY